MSYKIEYFLVIILLFGVQSMVYSQNTEENTQSMTFSQVKKLANSAIRNNDYYSAIDYYNSVVKLKPNNLKYQYRLAEFYRKTRDYKQADYWYGKAYKGNPDKYLLALYYQAQMQKSGALYEISKENFLIFIKKSKALKEGKYYKKLAKMAVQGCDMAISTKDSVPQIMIQHLDTSINKAHIESNPIYVDAQTVNYVSMRVEKLEYYSDQDSSKIIPKRNFYTLNKEKGYWKFKGKLNYPDSVAQNIANGTYSKDGKRFYYTKCKRNWKNKMICSIYISEKTNSGWSKARKLAGPINDSKYTATQPTIGINSKNNEEVLYFVSDRPGGKGGLDIWYASYNSKKGMFDKVKNAGNKINTIANEITPNYNTKIHALNFSSDYWVGYGGYDVFKIYGELRKWDGLENEGKLINSSEDDLYFSLSPNRESGMLVSNRVGGVSLKSETCCDDLYEFSYTNFIQLTVDANVWGRKDTAFYKMLLKKGLMTQSALDSVKNPIKINSYPVKLYRINKKTNERVLLINDSTREGKCVFDVEAGKDYELEIPSKNGAVVSMFTTQNISKSDSLHLGDIFVDIIPNEPINLDNVYYKFDKSDLTQKAKNTLDTTILELMYQYPKIVVEILSHTDSKGDDQYNLILSQSRAESVVQYLIKKGIASSRLLAKGYGETKPIAPNNLPNGQDNPKGRAKNRRTEFRIIGSVDKLIIYDNEPEDY